jgi:ribosome-associated translation inhibitor RaiA
MMVMADETPATVEENLRIVPQFTPDEYEKVVEIVSGKLDRRLKRFDAGAVDMEISVKERGAASQRVVLEARIAGQSRMVATSTRQDLWSAVAETRDDLFRQIDRAVTRTSPKSSRKRRDSPRR